MPLLNKIENYQNLNHSNLNFDTNFFTAYDVKIYILKKLKHLIFECQKLHLSKIRTLDDI